MNKKDIGDFLASSWANACDASGGVPVISLLAAPVLLPLGAMKVLKDDRELGDLIRNRGLTAAIDDSETSLCATDRTQQHYDMLRDVFGKRAVDAELSKRGAK